MKRKLVASIYAAAMCRTCNKLLQSMVGKRWDVSVLYCPICKCPCDVLNHHGYRFAGAVQGLTYAERIR